jgi:uncharacterized membrane protein
VIGAGAIIQAPLTRVPENTLKFIVGTMLTSFGTFWAAEGFGFAWPLSDAFIPILVAIYLLASYALVSWLKQYKRRQLAMTSASNASITTPAQEEVRP